MRGLYLGPRKAWRLRECQDDSNLLCGDPFVCQALDIAETLIKSATVDVVVIDSVAALVPRAELEGDMGDHHIALQVSIPRFGFSASVCDQKGLRKSGTKTGYATQACAMHGRLTGAPCRFMRRQARLMSQALRKLTATLNKSNTLLIFINQIRQKV